MQEYKQKLPNILALHLIKLSKWFSLVMPIIVLFYEDR